MVKIICENCHKFEMHYGNKLCCRCWTSKHWKEIRRDPIRSKHYLFVRRKNRQKNREKYNKYMRDYYHSHKTT